MAAAKTPVIALLGQPNSGKSTLFNRLTGSRQHVGNWPGKTVEKKEGEFTYNGTTWLVADLPGSYSLFANSDEEIITRDYIADGRADIVCILADASQLERSLYMLADFAGIRTPAILLLNMMDVAELQGKYIDAKKLEIRLGIPVLPFVAADKKQYEKLYPALERLLKEKRELRTEGLEDFYRRIPGGLYKEVLSCMPPEGIGQYSAMWLAVKYLENDRAVKERIQKQAPDCAGRLEELFAAPASSGTGSLTAADGGLLTGESKFAWIQQLIKDAVTKKSQENTVLGRFDRLATSRIWGKPLAVGVILLALVLSMVIASPIMFIGGAIPTVISAPLAGLLEAMGVHPILISLICELGINVVSFAVSMAGFVLGITFVFNLIEEIGYMARISFVFDGLMAKLGLQGKSIMAFFMGAGCTIGGATGTRIIDNWGQRVLAIALVWAVPCGATWAVMPTLASIFFGPGAILVMIAIIAFMFVFMAITAKIFGGTLAPKDQRMGMIMEMPPYHKPRWGNLIRVTLTHAKDIFLRALRVIALVTLVFWALSFSPNGDASASLIYKIGVTIEPVTKIFGLSWQTFIAFVLSALSKEAVLGVLNTLYMGSGTIFGSTVASSGTADGFAAVLTASIPKAEALAFMFATTFNVPCVVALASTQRETHSLKWTLRIAAYYTVMALLLSCLVYHVGLLIF